MTEIEKLQHIRARLVSARRQFTEGALKAPANTRFPAEGLSRIQAEIDAVDRALTDEAAVEDGAPIETGAIHA
jgi:hypothetical protein